MYRQVLTRGDLTDDPSPVCRAGEGVDLVRESVRMVLQELIEAEATEAIGAARYERSAARVTERNGTRPKLLTTKAGM